MTEITSILTIGELNDDGSLAGITGELLAVARKLSGETGAEVSTVLLGSGAAQRAQEAIALGADRVWAAEEALLQEYQVDAHLAALEQVCREASPQMVLVGRTQNGRELGPRLAFRLGAPLLQDCTDVSVDAATHRVVATRPVYGGNAQARVVSTQDPQVVCIRPKVFEPLEADPSRQGEVVQPQLSLDPSVVKVKRVDRVMEEAAGVRLEEAQVVVGVGRGIGGAENVPPFQELAKAMGAALGASRAVCDAGWLDYSHQVGLTGKSIAPQLYLTWAISGASQHLAGCSNAKNIVAVNKDPEANIFKEARFGVVGDWQKVLAGFTVKLKELLGQ